MAGWTFCIGPFRSTSQHNFPFFSSISTLTSPRKSSALRDILQIMKVTSEIDYKVSNRKWIRSGCGASVNVMILVRSGVVNSIRFSESIESAIEWRLNHRNPSQLVWSAIWLVASRTGICRPSNERLRMRKRRKKKFSDPRHTYHTYDTHPPQTIWMTNCVVVNGFNCRLDDSLSLWLTQWPLIEKHELKVNEEKISRKIFYRLW